MRDAAGGGAETSVMGNALANANRRTASDWSRDGRYLLHTETGSKTRGDIWYLENPLGGGKPVRFLGTDAMESQAQFSPDGHWVANTSNESARPKSIFVRSLPAWASGKYPPAGAVSRAGAPMGGRFIIWPRPTRTAPGRFLVTISANTAPAVINVIGNWQKAFAGVKQ